MTPDQQLPNIKVGRDAARDEAYESEEETVSTVEYLNYRAVEREGWDVDDEDLFEKAAAADLDDIDHGTLEVGEYEYVLDAAEEAGQSWPFECRAASCANCCAFVTEGDVEMDMNLFLTDEEVEEMGLRLTCVSTPASDEVKLVYNARSHDYLQTVVGQREV
ncbi:ferredoxin Fer [Halomarina ordinaria]|uniref:Ferredoxin Fer n=1 Tax=Halomarina ordinaria TaxID=3033939 RepID=A0ABD5UBJ3_9EURY|nr:ferredoxin Fer [Halomarina sp. PSRA2]